MKRKELPERERLTSGYLKSFFDRIAPSAREGELPALIASTRLRVAEHLDEARALQQRLR
mgnify:CR=1 FL=1